MRLFGHTFEAGRRPADPPARGKRVHFRTKDGREVSFPAVHGGSGRRTKHPPPRLAESNILRAKELFAELSPEARKRVKNEKSWIFKTAWDLQRGRVGKYGHR